MNIDWKDYKLYLEKLGFSKEQIREVKKIRENKKYERMTPEQFKFLMNAGIIKRTRKLKKLRTLIVVGNQILYLDIHHKAYNYCGYFVDEI